MAKKPAKKIGTYTVSLDDNGLHLVKAPGGKTLGKFKTQDEAEKFADACELDPPKPAND